MIHLIADNMNEDESLKPDGLSPAAVTEYKPFGVAEQENTTSETWVEFLRMQKAQKKKIMIAVDHFNRDETKGLQYLKMTHIVPEPPDPKALAYFYRFTPGLNKNKIGDFLGDPDEFNIQVLKEFTESFEFSGMNLDNGLKTFLETFRVAWGISENPDNS